MNRYILVICLTFIFLAPGVNAEECVNLFHGEPGNSFTSDYYLSENGTDRFRYGGNDYVGKDLTIYAMKDDVLVEDLSLGVDLFISLGGMYRSPGISTFTRNVSGSNNFYYLSYRANKMTPELLEEINTWQFWVVEGDSVCIPSVEPDPPVPIEPDFTLSGFYSIYLDKLKILNNFALENKFFMSFIGIILVFAILEIVIHLFSFNRGRSF